jgi:hypothetical protein
MIEQLLNHYQCNAVHDFAMVQEIIAKAAKASAQYDRLVSLVLKQGTETEVLMVLAEADKCVRQILMQMEELEGLFEKASLFQRQPSEARSEHT